jgi:adenylosuccinate lyase
VLLALVEAGLPRQEAYEIVQTQAKRIWRGEGDLKSLLWEQPRVRQHLSADDLDALFEVDYHLRHIEVPFARLGLG